MYTLCLVCRRDADKLAELIDIPERFAWQLQIGERAKYVGHWTVHHELESTKNAIEGQISSLDVLRISEGLTN